MDTRKCSECKASWGPNCSGLPHAARSSPLWATPVMWCSLWWLLCLLTPSGIQSPWTPMRSSSPLSYSCWRDHVELCPNDMSQIKGKEEHFNSKNCSLDRWGFHCLHSELKYRCITFPIPKNKISQNQRKTGSIPKSLPSLIFSSGFLHTAPGYNRYHTIFPLLPDSWTQKRG